MISGNSLVDYRFHFGVSAQTTHNLTRLTPREATSVKVFMTGHHTAPDVVDDPVVLDRVFATAAEAGLRLVLHAEDHGVFSLLDRNQSPPQTYDAYERVRPRSGGIVAVAKVIDLVRRHGTAAHVLHVSSAEESDLLRAARAAGLPLTFETTSHHLSFTAADTQRLGARIRLSPAIRQSYDQNALWDALTAGDIATLGSDHAPHTIAEKTRPAPEAPPGLPGVQELLTAVYTGLRRRYPDIPVDQQLMLLSQVCSARPAQLFGLDRQKGSIAQGLDADFALFDPDAHWLMSANHTRTKNGWSAYEGWTFTGRPDVTVRRGQLIWDGREGARFGSPDGIWLSAISQPSGPATTMAVAHRVPA